MYLIEVTSDFEQLWRYNIFATCGGFDAAGERLYVVGEESISSEEMQQGVVADVIAPVGFTPREMTLRLEFPDAERLDIIVYVVAHTLPEDRIVENSPPFDIQVKVTDGAKLIYHEIHKVNQWGGLTANINL